MVTQIEHSEPSFARSEHGIFPGTVSPPELRVCREIPRPRPRVWMGAASKAREARIRPYSTAEQRRWQCPAAAESGELFRGRSLAAVADALGAGWSKLQPHMPTPLGFRHKVPSSARETV
ncbi:MAG: hypothetical protein ACI9W2_001618 [Gammaproteobacteria bacterium]|jgi:hypothetical protein